MGLVDSECKVVPLHTMGHIGVSGL